MNKIKVGIIGCGAISNAYFKGCAPYRHMQLVACADLDEPRAAAKAKEHDIRACSVETLLRDPDLEILLNLTVPKAHAAINLAAIQAGKHTYAEKPFGVNRAEGKKVLAAAKKKNLRTGCAPDTFFGGGAQTARKLIDDGAIGQPVAGVAFMCGHGMETWHPNPEFYYKPGGGPMFDMGPYYITGLINLIGPVKRVTGATRISFPTRTITSQPFAGKVITVETPTHIAGTLEFANGAIITIIQSFDMWRHSLPILEVYGSEGSLSIPDPNRFDGVVKLAKPGAKDWTEVPLTHRTDLARGTGLADMAQGIATGRPHRASGEMAFHVLDVMAAFEESATTGKHIQIKSTCERPAALPVGLPLGELD
ncbi:MAG: 1,5-anhydro-D-fructose reductase [Verrucomicrobiae bacterium]|nr:1,5-anhydro-D-fructose reductase [Verrucomicrobiae bacterium]